ncbi:hypothetical protein BC332_14392 [Capsicum chinense]|nr:hypothetical protein BC332_14392 [Capsicum chinense]
MEDLCSIGRFGKRDFDVKRKYEYMPNPNAETGTGSKMQLREDDHDKAKKVYQTKGESLMNVAQIHIVVATLIMTVTFAAGITLPGGFESDPNSPNQGMAILIRKTAFRAFVVSDAIAFTFSAVAIFIYFSMADISIDPQHKKILIKLYNLAIICQSLSMLAVVIAFATALPITSLVYSTSLETIHSQSLEAPHGASTPLAFTYPDHLRFACRILLFISRIHAIRRSRHR